MDPKSIGLFAVGATGGIAVAILGVSFSFIRPALRRICLPYVPATDNQVKNVLQILGRRRGSLIDLGSGDGRIVIEAARAGFSAHGIDLNPWLVSYSKFQATRLGLRKNATFQKHDIWKTNLRNYDNVVIFGVDEMMHELELKFVDELKSGSCIVACRFPLPHWNPLMLIGEGIDKVWLYEKP